MSGTALRILVTGANAGVGREIARDLYARGHHVVMAVRNVDKGDQAKADIEKSSITSKGSLHVMQVHLDKQISIAQFIKEFKTTYTSLDALINNAAIVPQEREETEDGLELSFATNIMAYHLLTKGLLPLLESAPAGGRIVNIASQYAGGLKVDDLNWTKRSYDPNAAYRQTKQANRMLSWKWNRILKASKSNVTINACHPGVLSTGLLSDLGFGHGAAPVNGAKTPVFLAVDPSVAGISGSFWDNKRDVGCSWISKESDCDKLWDAVEACVKVDLK